MDKGICHGLQAEGARLLLLGMPKGTEFGIDLNFWTVGENFRGIKKIPPGLHFIYFSAVSRQGVTAPRTGFFHFFGARELVIRHYDPATEDLKPQGLNQEQQEEEEEERQRVFSNLPEVDRYLGIYPLESWDKWVSLTQHVSEAELTRMAPLSGRVCSAAELVPVTPFVSSRSQRHNNTTDRDAHTDSLHFLATERQQIGTTNTTSSPCTDSLMDDTDTDTPINTKTQTPITAPTEQQPRHTDTQASYTDTHTPINTNTHTQPSYTETDTSLAQRNTHLIHTDIQPSHSNTHINTDTNIETDTHRQRQTQNQSLPQMEFQPGTEFRFSSASSRTYRPGASASEITKYSLDSSYSIRHRLDQVEGPHSLLAEIQLSFISFLVGQVWPCWEHWRALLSELCRAEEVLLNNPQLYSNLLSTLHYQLTQIPADMFVDIVESNNFLASSLTTLFANIADNAATLPPSLHPKAQRFKQHLNAKFGWDLNLEEEGEEAPVVVEL